MVHTNVSSIFQLWNYVYNHTVCRKGLHLQPFKYFYNQTVHASVCVFVCMHALLTCMSQAEGPEAQVGSCVGDTSQTVLYGVDGLVDSHVTKVKLLGKEM